MRKDYCDWPWKPMDTIPVDSELNSLLRLNPEFPLAVSHDDLSEYKNAFVNWHKQSSIEISVVKKGSVIVNLLNYREEVRSGEGFIILPGVLHSIRSSGSAAPAVYDTMIFEPHLLTGYKGSYFEKCYYKPEIINGSGYFHFLTDREYLPYFMDIFNDIYWGDAYLENQIQHKLQQIWIALWNHVMTGQTGAFHRTEDTRLFMMISFLQKNYQKKFSLDELCEYVSLSRSACCRYFKKMMNMSISDYLLEYRLTQALYLLKSSHMSITETAFHTGFTSTSYFISRFKEKMNMTPQEYKNRSR